jgi:trigger factor
LLRGLLLSEIGTANGVEVSQQEMNRLVAQAAQQYGPEDRQRFIQYVQQEPMAAAQLRAPLFEDKVVDYLFDKAEISDREVTREELEAAIESDEGFDTGTHTHDHDNHKPKAKKAAAKKPAADDDAKPAKKTKAEPKAEEATADEPAKKAAKPKKVEKADIEPAAPGDELVEAEPVKKAATKKAPAAKAEAAEAPAKPAKKAPAKKKAD